MVIAGLGLGISYHNFKSASADEAEESKTASIIYVVPGEAINNGDSMDAITLTNLSGIPSEIFSDDPTFKDLYVNSHEGLASMEKAKDSIQVLSYFSNGFWTLDETVPMVGKIMFPDRELTPEFKESFANGLENYKKELAGYTFSVDGWQRFLQQPAITNGTEAGIDYSYTIGQAADSTADTNLFVHNDSSLVHVTYASSDGQTILPKDRDLTGFAGEVITDDHVFPKIEGYTANINSVTLDGTEKDLKVFYQKNPSASSSSETGDSVRNSSFKVYGKQKFYRYKNVDFKKNERIQKYVKKPRIYAPIFKVVGTATSKAGNPRYKLSDGTYITAKSDYVAKLYWQKMTTQTMYVTNPKGIKTHATTTFNDQLSRLKQGTAVPVTKLVKVGNVTRYELPDGTYITGSKCYVTPNKPRTVIKVQGRDGRNRYSDVNLNERLQHYKKGHVFKVTGWDYSHGWNKTVHGTKRYKVAGGYITGNPKLVKIVK